MSFVLKYAFFAIVATLTNIFCQDLLSRLYQGRFELYVSMAAGTAAGLLAKYVLDKKYIFLFQTRDLFHDGRIFLLYAIMGVGTTCVFWGVEMAFDYTFRTLSMRYAGAIIGLCLGYFAKYRLDRRFVFVELA